MVTSGSSQNTEIIDLVDATNVCTGLANYPIKDTDSISAGLLNKTTPLLCGGYTNNGRLDGCYTIGATKVEKVATLSKPRSGAASVAINETTLWLTGGMMGTSEYFVPQKSSEIIQLGGETTTVTAGQDLPVILNQHCMLLLNATTIIVIGGTSGNALSSASYYFDIQQLEGQWVQGPSMLEKRESHACGIFTSNFHNNQRTLVVTGGKPLTTSSEFLVLGESKWTKGKCPSPSPRTSLKSESENFGL
jgi:hypothetical protein